MNLQKLEVEKVPVWVKFPEFPLEYWTPKALGKVASYIGVPLATDRLTACRDRLAFARVLIDVKISMSLYGKCQLLQRMER